MAVVKSRNGFWHVGLMNRGVYTTRSTGIRVTSRTPPPEVLSIRNEIEERIAAEKFGVFHLTRVRVAKSVEEFVSASRCVNTAKCRKKAFRHILDGLWDKCVHEVTVGHAEDNVRRMAQSLHRSSCQTNVNVAKAWWTWCSKRGYCKKEFNPFSSVMDVVNLPTGPSKPKRALTADERAHILKALSGSHLTTAMIGFYSGSRLSEWLGGGGWGCGLQCQRAHHHRCQVQEAGGQAAPREPQILSCRHQREGLAQGQQHRQGLLFGL